MLISALERVDVALLGAGREGQSAWRAIRARFPHKPLTLYSEHPVDERFEDRLEPGRDRLVSGPLSARRLARHAVLVRSPGISPYRPELRAARAAGARITSASNLWFAEHDTARTICITGTKGKSTTSALTAHLLAAAGCTVRLAGNIGTPLLDCANDSVDWWVIEVSSYQLADLEARPTLAAVLNLSDEHLDWHGGRGAYHADKLRIIELAAGRPVVANHADALLRERLHGVPHVHWFGHPQGYHVRAHRLWRAEEELAEVPREHLPGDHNLVNLAAALSLVQLAGVDAVGTLPSLRKFRGLPHRMQRLGTREGVTFVNDSMSTAPLATEAALRALAGERVTLLAGGLDRGVDWGACLQALRELPPQAIVLLPDSGARLATELRGAGIEPAAGVFLAADLADAVRHALQVTPKGGTILLSPGAPSFPHFRDYAHRGRTFAACCGFAQK
ncbi:MAG: UDP-N-acetylmuramoyl-L-alanine--D-glutamate ligase [Xanthomonadales bacterium]|nr:UDP-N-acetylmuramoyl-L-alanine--D-glutamate ligase [Xanthomonadales bacterium]NIN58290.1 UDP-N-acetylmuramoyl-L-alanine--D-glutamate ligase [Xanthomonadales bacterium]NIN73635.1 UDP-N-acetylmuramoyl-L-alanine--D-glutamate ligase [Xanthomonadales bacterium]NIO14420.1 UDP-N-acetylmuramoyl-L-alanine--D-glutamate ligase [Xanthomonadales bacterium]NIP10683.1 UDP-N-acetylmuramoyl-L-alanine--D-glutamate ligase [Xanthomonadales bacterium]